MDSTSHFDHIADSYEDLRPVFTPVMDSLARVLALKADAVVVDYGCGPGHDIRYLADHYRIHPIGVDKSEEMCRVASGKNGIDRVIRGDRLSCLRDVPFDKIYLKFVMHHIRQPLQFVDELAGLMKEGDSFAIVTMLPAHLESYALLKYFPSLAPLLTTSALEQQAVFDHLRQNRQITFNCLECDVNEEVFDQSLLHKLKNNYSSFFSFLSDEEKREGMEKVKKQLDKTNNPKYITKGVIGYGRKEE